MTRPTDAELLLAAGIAGLATDLDHLEALSEVGVEVSTAHYEAVTSDLDRLLRKKTGEAEVNPVMTETYIKDARALLAHHTEALDDLLRRKGML